MKKRLNYLLIPFCFFLILTASGSGIYFIHIQIERSKEELNAKIDIALEQAIIDFIKSKSNNTSMVGGLNNHPESFGKYETRTYQDADTSFVYQHKIVDINTFIYHGVQRYLLFTGELQSKSIKNELDSILTNKKIKVKTTLGIRSSGYPVKQLPWSGDTLAIHQNGCAQYTMTDDFTQIHYTAYLEYAPATIWAQMNKTPIWLWSIAVLILSVLAIYQIITNKKKQIEIIEEEESAIKEEPVEENIETEEKKELSIEKKYIIFGNNRMKASPQSLNILQLFLTAPNHRMEKKKLKELWSTKGDQLNSMTTAIYRLNSTLHEIGCDLRIISDPEDANFYLLQ